MLITAAIVPGPPAFVAELMGSAAHELDDLRHAAGSVVSRAVSDCVAASADSSSSGADSTGVGSVQLVIVGPGQPGEFNAAERHGSGGVELPRLTWAHDHQLHRANTCRVGP